MIKYNSPEFRYAMRRIGIWPQFWNSIDLAGDAIDLLPRGCNILLTGLNGRGKTTLISAFISQIIIDSHPSHFVWDTPIRWFFFPDLLSRIKDTYVGSSGWHESERDILNEVVNVRLLVLDDVGSQHKVDFAMSILLQIMAGREGRELCTIITSNLEIDDFARLDARIASRLSGYFHKKLVGEDFRVRD